MLWGAKLNDLTEEGTNDSPDEVLAYLKDVPEKGGLVLMKNRKIKSMTPEEFKAAPKAGTESPPPKAQALSDGRGSCGWPGCRERS